MVLGQSGSVTAPPVSSRPLERSKNVAEEDEEFETSGAERRRDIRRNPINFIDTVHA